MSDIRIKMAKDLRDMSDMVGDLHWMAAKAVEDLIKKDARIEVQEAQIKILQSDANSWQSGYDEGRRMGAKHAAPAAKPQVVMPELELQGAADEAFRAWEKAGDRIPDAMAYMAARDGFREGAAWQASLNAAPAPVCKTCADSGCDPAFKALVPCSGCAAAPVQQVSVPGAIRYTSDGELAECPCCGSLDVGGAHDTVNCYGCGLQITKPRPLQNAADAWNRRAMLASAPAAPAADGWISVSERLPLTDGQYWCFFSEEHPSTLKQRVCIFIERQQEFCDWTVTHWMPLPAAPAAHRAQGVV